MYVPKANQSGDQHNVDYWSSYNQYQRERNTERELLTKALLETGPSGGRVAVDLGAGAGVEARALLRAGWQVHAYDYDEEALHWLETSVPDGDVERLRTVSGDLGDLESLPEADLIYSGYTLSWLPVAAFVHVWELIRAALRPGAVLAVNIFGDHDDWASDTSLTCLSEQSVRDLLGDLTVLSFEVQDEDGPAFSGPKHWHVFHVIARA